MMEETIPLTGSSSSSPFRYLPLKIKIALYVLIGLVVALSISSIVLIAELAKQKDSSSTPAPPGIVCPADPIIENSNADYPFSSYAPWDITANHTRNFQFQTNEGTWMNVDVSPDGTNILFDLLGDLYTLPIGGGTASLLKGGVEFDTQPRYSPDGKYISFTSDLSGCDNLWIMELSSRKKWQATNEPYHWVSNAVWSPDGQFLVAVKWFTSTRSLGAGELWKYPIDYVTNNASSGSRLVGRVSSSSQIGPEEPYMSDAQSIYYSQNVADSTVWTYSKDPHTLIYQIRLYNTVTQAISVVSSGRGGAARPIMNHKKDTLAFIKRVEFNTSLMLRNMDSGNEIILFDDLYNDQQECYAPSGVYPTFAWLPDDSAIIVWGKGNIYRVNVATGASSVIPFTVNVNLALAPTLRVQSNASYGTSFNIKAITWASMTNDKSKAYFTAIGTTYSKSLNPLGAPTPVAPPDNETLQFSPSLSPDGKFLVHTVWKDSTFGNIEVVSLTNPNYRVTITSIPGRYSKPSFSPDMTSIVYYRHGGDTSSGSTFSLNPGVYLTSISVNGTSINVLETRFITRSASSIVFGKDSSTLFVVQGGYPQTNLVVLNLGATSVSQKTLVSSKFATKITVSPNLKYVAFVEFYNVYFVPLDSSALEEDGKPMWVTMRPGLSPTGLKRCSYPGGDYISWSSDSSFLTWGLGPYLYQVSVDDLLNCNDDACVQTKVTQYDLSFQAPTSVPTGNIPIVFDNATIITMENDQIISDGRIIILGEQIIAVGSKADVPIPPEHILVDVANGVVLPGYIDVHAHWSVGSTDYKVQQDWQMMLNLAYGVTTLHNPSAETDAVFTDAELIESGKKVGPRIFSTGTILYGAAGPYHCEIDNFEDAVANVQRLKTWGAISVKSYNQPCRTARQQILQAARQIGINVVPEGGMAFYWNLNQIIDGHTTIEHSLPMAPLYNDVISLFSFSGTAYTPTLIVNYGGIWGERWWYQEYNVWEEKRLMNFAPQNEIRASSMRRTESDSPKDYHHFRTTASVANIYRAGGLVQLGAHGQLQGLGYHWEIGMFSQGNLSNLDVLKAATILGARGIGLDQYIGSIKVGKLADLIIYPPNQDPYYGNITENSKLVKYVVKAGNVYDAATMDQLYPTFKKRGIPPEVNLPHV